jgi:ribose-phosphate pyrophosphokinase
MKILSGTSNLKLSKDISKQLKLKLINTNIKRFADGEIYIEINENIRGNSVFVIQSTSTPANDNIMELLLSIDALRRSSAKNITAVIPYFGYARQDRKVAPRTSISAKVVSNLITNAGANRIVTVDLHAGQIQGFFDIPVDNLFTTPLFARYIKKKFKANNNLICVSPDVGGVQRTRGLATKIKADLAIIDKRRPEPGKSEVMNIIGDVKGKHCIIVDDIIDSGGTIINAVDALKKAGAKDVYVFITHAVLSGQAVEKIKKSQIKKLIITDTIENTSKIKNNSKIEVISIAPLMAEAINRISNSTSVSDLFN